MTEMTRTSPAGYNFPTSVLTERQDLEKVFRGMRELEYCPSKIKEFSESFCKAGLVAVHLSSSDRWEKLRKRLSPELRLDKEDQEQCSCSSPLQAEAPITEEYVPAPSNNHTSLEEISLLDIKIGVSYQGQAVYGALCVEPFISVKFFTAYTATVINTLLEDNFGRVVRVLVNLGPVDNFLKTAKIAQVIAKYSRGSPIGIESPNLRRCGWDKSLVLYVDHTAKVHFVINPRMVPTLTSVKAAADVMTRQTEAKLNEAAALFNKQDWFAAVQVYTECINGCKQLMEGSNVVPQGRSELVDQLEVQELLWLALMGRCATWLHIKNNKRALSDANKALELEPHIVAQTLESCKQKVHFMKGSALFSLERFQEAADAFNVALRYNPEDKSVQRALERSKLCHDLDSLLPSLEDTAISSDDSTVVSDFQSAYQQSQHGKFDLSEYFLSDETTPPPIYASYVGPVEIRSREGRGRGVFLRESVVAGQLLVVSEALALLSRTPKHVATYESVLPIIGQDLESSARRDMSLDIQEELVTQLACKMLSLKGLVPQVYSLGDGRSDESSVIPDMEIFQPSCSDQLEVRGLSDDDNVNIKILREIVAENAIPDCDSFKAGRSWGVWSLPSFINHSCHPNSHKIKVGDFLIIYASRDLSEGAEITLPYLNVFQTMDGRRADSLALGFICKCSRCLLEQSLPCYFHNLQRKVAALLEMAMCEDDDQNVENPTSLFELARLAEALEQEMSHYAYTGEEKNWIRASIIDPYIACSRLSNSELQELHPSSPGINRTSRMSLLVDAFTAVDAGNKLGKKFAVHMLHEFGHHYGWGSAEHLRQELRVLKIYRTSYGIINTDTLRQLIAKVRLEC